MAYPRAVGVRSTSTLESGSGWQSGISADVCFAARMPASRAACSGSPFFTAPRRINRNTSADIAIDPRAIASRAVTGLSPTSTIFTRPRRSTCDNADHRDGGSLSAIFFTSSGAPPFFLCARGPTPAPDTLAPWRSRVSRTGRLVTVCVFLRQKEREAFERHGEVDALQFHVVGNLQ